MLVRPHDQWEPRMHTLQEQFQQVSLDGGQTPVCTSIKGMFQRGAASRASPYRAPCRCAIACWQAFRAALCGSRTHAQRQAEMRSVKEEHEGRVPGRNHCES